MKIVNAISKVRFSAAKPQRVHLVESDEASVDMLCMEAGQQLEVHSAPATYYVITGAAEIEAGDAVQALPMGQLAHIPAGQAHTVINTGQGRLLCLAYRP